MKINAYAAKEIKGKLEPFTYDAKELGPFDILIRITHCGICHSDLHLLDNDWGVTAYPFVPGHEIIGVVLATGSFVSRLHKGDRVGVGWQKSSCHQCEYCLSAFETACPFKEETCVHNHGGFAERIVTDSRFAFKIPNSLDAARTAPMLCGGITVFTPIERYVRSTMRVGVIGIGGLGHMALQFMSAFGAEVVAFSHSPEKEQEALSLGADHFLSSLNKDSKKELDGKLDFILSTVPVPLDFQQFISLLRPNGRLCIVGAVPEPLQIPAFQLIVGNKGLVGSATGSRSTMLKMLRFAGRNSIGAEVETMPISQANQAIEKVRKNRPRYRMVLEAD